MKEAGKLGVKLAWFPPSTPDSPSSQVEAAKKALAARPTVLIVDPISNRGLAPVINQAHARGIGVLTVDNTVTNTSKLVAEVSSDSVEAGREAAKLMVRAGERAVGTSSQPVPPSIPPGSPPKRGAVYAVGGSGFSTDTSVSVKAFSNAVSAYKEWSYKGHELTGYNASAAAQSAARLLGDVPSLSGIFVTNSASAPGVVSSIGQSRRGKDVTTVAVGATTHEMHSLADGALAGLVTPRPAVEAALSVSYGYDWAIGKDNYIQRSAIISDVVVPRAKASADSKWQYCTSVASCSNPWAPTQDNGLTTTAVQPPQASRTNCQRAGSQRGDCREAP